MDSPTVSASFFTVASAHTPCPSVHQTRRVTPFPDLPCPPSRQGHLAKRHNATDCPSNAATSIPISRPYYSAHQMSQPLGLHGVPAAAAAIPRVFPSKSPPVRTPDKSPNTASLVESSSVKKCLRAAGGVNCDHFNSSTLRRRRDAQPHTSPSGRHTLRLAHSQFHVPPQPSQALTACLPEHSPSAPTTRHPCYHASKCLGNKITPDGLTLCRSFNRANLFS